MLPTLLQLQLKICFKYILYISSSESSLHADYKGHVFVDRIFSIFYQMNLSVLCIVLILLDNNSSTSSTDIISIKFTSLISLIYVNVRSVPSTKYNLDLLSLHVLRRCLICCLDNLYLIAVISLTFANLNYFLQTMSIVLPWLNIKWLNTIIVKLIKYSLGILYGK